MNEASKLEALGILAEMKSLPGLDDYRKGLADGLAKLIRSGDRPSIQEVYCSLDWWGGSGSFADFIPDANQTGHMKLLIRLAHTFELAGYPCPRAKRWTDVFERWIRNGIIRDR